MKVLEEFRRPAKYQGAPLVSDISFFGATKSEKSQQYVSTLPSLEEDDFLNSSLSVYLASKQS